MTQQTWGLVWDRMQLFGLFYLYFWSILRDSDQDLLQLILNLQYLQP